MSRLFELTGVEGTLETTTDAATAGLPAEHNGAGRNGLPKRFRGAGAAHLVIGTLDQLPFVTPE